MELNTINKMKKREQERAIYLIRHALRLDMDISGYGEVGVNESTGNIYIWIEDYNFSLYMGPESDLIIEDIYAVWSDPYNGMEEEMELKKTTRLIDIEEWARSCFIKSEEQQNGE